MSDAPKPQLNQAPARPAAYGTNTSVPDYILGITYEIWEERQVDQIRQYYSDDVIVYGMDGITEGGARMVEHTRATLEAFPDRILIGDDVIWTGSTTEGFSSHRVFSPMTNLGRSVFGPATGRPVRVMNIADCKINDGLITREWLVRDNLALVTQLGFDPLPAARDMSRRFSVTFLEWLQGEYVRVRRCDPATAPAGPLDSNSGDAEFARLVLEACWVSGNTARLDSLYAPYCVLQRAPVRWFSGRQAVLSHFAQWRTAIPDARISVDHVCSQPFGAGGRHIAARWCLAGKQQGSFSGCEARQKPLFILGVSHWRVLDGIVIAEWTVFDELALMAQAVDERM